MARMPQVSARELIRFLKSQGFVEDRQSEAHLTLRHASRKVTVTVPVHTGADVGRGLAVRILKDAASPSATICGCAEAEADSRRTSDLISARGDGHSAAERNRDPGRGAATAAGVIGRRGGAGPLRVR